MVRLMHTVQQCGNWASVDTSTCGLAAYARCVSLGSKHDWHAHYVLHVATCTRLMHFGRLSAWQIGRYQCGSCPATLSILRAVKYGPDAGLFYDLQSRDKFEASGITHYNGRYVMVFDNLNEIGFVDHHLDVFGKQNVLAAEKSSALGTRLRGSGDSEYEAITHRTRTGVACIELIYGLCMCVCVYVRCHWWRLQACSCHACLPYSALRRNVQKQV